MQAVLYTVDKGLHGRNVLQSVVIDSATHLLEINVPLTAEQCSFYDVTLRMMLYVVRV